MDNETKAFKYPDMDWCYDVEMYYATLMTAVAAPLMKSFSDYKHFSYKYNGILTTILVVLGLIGSILLLFQIRTSRHFSKRLSVHLGMICIWDSLYLLSCLATYGVPSLVYGMPPSYGFISYILFVLQPFASFCVSCTIWQVVAITIERYYAVTKPLEQRTRKAKFGVYWICLAIVFGAFVVNLLPVPFERHLVDCFELGEDSFKYYTLLKPYDDTPQRLYRFVVHFFPDFLFRAPCPILVIGYLTVKTIQVCNQRTVGHLQINSNPRRNIPLRLSLLNFKFVICNTLYMFNTILLELLGYGDTVDEAEDNKIDRYMNSYYLTDASNLLLVVHSATNWLIFYQLPSYNNRKNGLSALSLSNSFKGHTVKPEVAEFVHRRITANKTAVGENVLKTLFEEYPELRLAISGEKTDGETVGTFLEQLLKWFSSSSRGEKLRELGRRLGEENFNRSLHFSPEQWKDIRTKVVDIIVKHTLSVQPAPYTKTEVHDNLTKAFNLVLSEMRSGSLCAAVEAHRKISLKGEAETKELEEEQIDKVANNQRMPGEKDKSPESGELESKENTKVVARQQPDSAAVNSSLQMKLVQARIEIKTMETEKDPEIDKGEFTLYFQGFFWPDLLSHLQRGLLPIRMSKKWWKIRVSRGGSIILLPRRIAAKLKTV